MGGLPPAQHVIRLRGHWQPSADGSGRFRAFGRPARLSPQERVWLVVGQLSPGAAVALNGHRLGTTDDSGTFAADITPLLAPRNRLEVLPAVAAVDASATGSVAATTAADRPDEPAAALHIVAAATPP